MELRLYFNVRLFVKKKLKIYFKKMGMVMKKMESKKKEKKKNILRSE